MSKVDDHVRILKQLDKIELILECTMGIFKDLKEYHEKIMELEKRVKELENG